MGGGGPFGAASGPEMPVAVENFHVLQVRQTADQPSTPGRVNLLNWDGKGAPTGLFPPTSSGPATVSDPGTPDTSGGATGPGGTGGLTGGADLK
jgi:nitrate reductase beta subunit